MNVFRRMKSPSFLESHEKFADRDLFFRLFIFEIFSKAVCLCVLRFAICQRIFRARCCRFFFSFYFTFLSVIWIYDHRMTNGHVWSFKFNFVLFPCETVRCCFHFLFSFRSFRLFALFSAMRFRRAFHVFFFRLRFSTHPRQIMTMLSQWMR